MSTTPMSDTDVLTIVKLLAADHDLEFTAQATRFTAEQVRQVASNHGFPNIEHLKWAVDALEKKVAAAALPQPAPSPRPRPSSVPRPAPRPVSPRPTPGAPRPAAEQPAAAKPAAGHDPEPHDDVVLAGLESDKASTRRLAARAQKTLDELRAAVRAEQAERERRREEAARRAAAEQEIAALQARIAELQSAAGLTASPATPSVSAKEIRAWAQRSGVQVPAVGRIPAQIREQYQAATAA